MLNMYNIPPSLRPIQETIVFSEEEKEELRNWAFLLSTTTFPQGRKKLYNEEDCGYCCLGIYAYEKTRETVWTSHVCSMHLLPNSLQEKLGLHHTLYGISLQIYFMGMNDGIRLTFYEISTMVLFLLVNGTFPSSLLDRIWEDQHNAFVV